MTGPQEELGVTGEGDPGEGQEEMSLEELDHKHKSQQSGMSLESTGLGPMCEQEYKSTMSQCLWALGQARESQGAMSLGKSALCCESFALGQVECETLRMLAGETVESRVAGTCLDT